MKHPLYRVTGFEFISEYGLRVLFDDGSSQNIDFGRRNIRPTSRCDSLQAGDHRSRSPHSCLAEWCRFRSRHASRLAGAQHRTRSARPVMDTLTDVVHPVMVGEAVTRPAATSKPRMPLLTHVAPQQMGHCH